MLPHITGKQSFELPFQLYAIVPVFLLYALRNSLGMHQRIEVDRPTHTEGLRHQELRSVFIPISILQALDGWHTKIIRNTSELAVPCALRGRKAQLLTDSRGYHKRDGHTYESI